MRTRSERSKGEGIRKLEDTTPRQSCDHIDPGVALILYLQREVFSYPEDEEAHCTAQGPPGRTHHGSLDAKEQEHRARVYFIRDPKYGKKRETIGFRDALRAGKE